MKRKFVHEDIYFATRSAELLLFFFCNSLPTVVVLIKNIKHLFSSLLSHMFKKGYVFVVLSYFFCYHSALKQLFIPTSTLQQKRDTGILFALCF